LQKPPLQTVFDEALALSTHAQLVPLRASAPVLHGQPGFVLHAEPMAQLKQPPSPSQKPPVHNAPWPRGVWLSMQVCAPVAHEVTPARHGLGGVVHDWLGVQETHVPLGLQTSLVPHVVPASRLALPSLHTAPPMLQSVVPLRQGDGLPVQAAPCVQTPQLPALQL
jgi:hypothetical protein